MVYHPIFYLFQGQIVYEAIGNLKAPYYFTVDRFTGAINLVRPLKGDQTLRYHVSGLLLLFSFMFLFYNQTYFKYCFHRNETRLKNHV